LPAIWVHIWRVSRVSRQESNGSGGQGIGQVYDSQNRGSRAAVGGAEDILLPANQTVECPASLIQFRSPPLEAL
jgi:hypothetical protein